MQIPIIRRGVAIGNSSAAGSLNFTVVCNSTQPENPAENTIWINTSIPMGSWYAMPSEPESFVEGDVWLQLAPSSFSIEVTEDNQLNVEISKIKQYTSKGWISRSAMIYLNGEWVEADMNEKIILDAEGWRYNHSFRSNTDYSDVTIYNDEYPVRLNMYRYSAPYIQDVDFTDYDVLEIEAEGYYESERDFYFGVTDNTTYNHNNMLTSTWLYENFPRNIYSFDVSNITGKHHIKFKAWGTNKQIKIYSIKLRKIKEPARIIFDGSWPDTTGFKTDNTSKTIVDNTVSPATIQFSGSTTNSNSAAYLELQIANREALEIEYSFEKYQWAYIGLSTDKTWYDAKTTNLAVYKYHAEGTTAERQIITLPLNGLSGTYYLKIYSWSDKAHTFKLYNLRLR